MEAIPTRANKIESNPITSKSFFEENPLSENHQIVSTATKQGELILSIVQNRNAYAEWRRSDCENGGRPH